MCCGDLCFPLLLLITKKASHPYRQIFSRVNSVLFIHETHAFQTRNYMCSINVGLLGIESNPKGKIQPIKVKSILGMGFHYMGLHYTG
jgi:hypothetical protein